MRDHRFDVQPEITDISDRVWAHTGEGVVRPPGRNPTRNKRKARQTKLSRRRNR